MKYYKRRDIQEFLNQFEHKEMYLFIKNRLDVLTNDGDYMDGLKDDDIFKKVATEASNKFNLSISDVYEEYDNIEFKVSDFMNSNKYS